MHVILNKEAPEISCKTKKVLILCACNVVWISEQEFRECVVRVSSLEGVNPRRVPAVEEGQRLVRQFRAELDVVLAARITHRVAVNQVADAIGFRTLVAGRAAESRVSRDIDGGKAVYG